VNRGPSSGGAISAAVSGLVRGAVRRAPPAPRRRAGARPIPTVGAVPRTGTGGRTKAAGRGQQRDTRGRRSGALAARRRTTWTGRPCRPAAERMGARPQGTCPFSHHRAGPRRGRGRAALDIREPPGVDEQAFRAHRPQGIRRGPSTFRPLGSRDLAAPDGMVEYPKPSDGVRQDPRPARRDFGARSPPGERLAARRGLPRPAVRHAPAFGLPRNRFTRSLPPDGQKVAPGPGEALAESGARPVPPPTRAHPPD
jgi:hypothetical protein